MRSIATLCLLTFALASCGKSGGTAGLYATQIEELKQDLPTEPASRQKEAATAASQAAANADQSFDAADSVAADASESVSIPTSTPQIAYSYTYGYRLSDGEIGGVQQKHVALCEQMGVAHCRVSAMKRDSNDGEFVNASLTLEVDAKQIKPFSAALDKAVGDSDGEATNRSTAAEDLSKQMVDTAARIKAKQALADRLMVLLQNRNGKVGELVEAERAFAQAQEELDAARTWMAEMQQRVGMSNIVITYQSRTPSGSGLWRPIRDSVASVGQTLGGSVGTLVSFVAAILPWLLALTGLIWLFRRLGWLGKLRLPWPKRWRRGDPESKT